ncbi:MAG: hypothetical protein ACI9U2_004910, partial [Bradymonadia bacterium]
GGGSGSGWPSGPGSGWGAASSSVERSPRTQTPSPSGRSAQKNPLMHCLSDSQAKLWPWVTVLWQPSAVRARDEMASNMAGRRDQDIRILQRGTVRRPRAVDGAATRERKEGRGATSSVGDVNTGDVSMGNLESMRVDPHVRPPPLIVGGMPCQPRCPALRLLQSPLRAARCRSIRVGPVHGPKRPRPMRPRRPSAAPQRAIMRAQSMIEPGGDAHIGARGRRRDEHIEPPARGN